MTKQEKKQPRKTNDFSDFMPFAEQMRKMFAGKSDNWDCTRMMASCCGGKTGRQHQPKTTATENKRPTTK